MNRLCNILALCSIILAACTPERLADKVDPLIGSGGHGHVFVGQDIGATLRLPRKASVAH